MGMSRVICNSVAFMRILAALISIFASGNVRGDTQAGIAAYNKGDFDTAKREFAAAAEAKDPAGQHLLASLYYQGHGVEKNLVRAVELFEEAAKKGYAPSLHNLGLMHSKGDGVARDMKKAVYYYTEAGKKGDLPSAYQLGQLYRKGEEVGQDFVKAAAYYKFAAERGHVSAANEYGLLFAQGQGVEVNYVEAYGWISYAARDGDGQSSKNLLQLKEILGEDLGKADQRAKEVRGIIAGKTGRAN